MNRLLSKRRLGFLCAAFLVCGPAVAQDGAMPAKARWLARQLDSFGVETKWPAGVHVNWRTGVPDGMPEPYPGQHTHCSAFVASAAEHLGIYILRPPEHRQTLLANAQNEWLATYGRSEGWRRLGSPIEAQKAANEGQLVVASYHNHRDNKPGHIAIIRPGGKSESALMAEGPDVIQAAAVNSRSISLRAGFAGHPSAWNEQQIDFYAHVVNTGSQGPGAGP